MAKKILIAEDERPLSKALELKLRNVGYEVVTVSDGQEAIDLLAKGGFDVLLLDLIMPRADGFAVLEAINAKKVKIKTIVLSNLGQAEILPCEKIGSIGLFREGRYTIGNYY